MLMLKKKIVTSGRMYSLKHAMNILKKLRIKDIGLKRPNASETFKLKQMDAITVQLRSVLSLTPQGVLYSSTINWNILECVTFVQNVRSHSRKKPSAINMRKLVQQVIFHKGPSSLFYQH